MEVFVYRVSYAVTKHATPTATCRETLSAANPRASARLCARGGGRTVDGRWRAMGRRRPNRQEAEEGGGGG